MTVKYLRGNAFEGSGNAVVVTTNCVGAMGRGIALECKLRHPWLYSTYYRLCRRALYQPGVIDEKFCVFNNQRLLENGNHANVVLFPTKGNWKAPSRIEWIESGIKDLLEVTNHHGWTRVDMTLPGCSNGWIKDKQAVKDILSKYLDESETLFCVYQLQDSAI